MSEMLAPTPNTKDSYNYTHFEKLRKRSDGGLFYLVCPHFI